MIMNTAATTVTVSLLLQCISFHRSRRGYICSQGVMITRRSFCSKLLFTNHFRHLVSTTNYSLLRSTYLPKMTSTTIVGIDVGTLTTKITLSSQHDFEIVRNAHGGHTTPTAVTFAGFTRPRLLGEDAVDVGRGDVNNIHS